MAKKCDPVWPCSRYLADGSYDRGYSRHCLWALGGHQRKWRAFDGRRYVSRSESALAGEPTGRYGNKSSLNQILGHTDVFLRKAMSAVKQNDERKGTSAIRSGYRH